MNQYLQNAVYGKGTQRHLDFIASIGGMTEDEKKLFEMNHDGKTELYIEEELHLSRPTYKAMEESVRQKTMLAVFECINRYMEHME